MQQGIVVVLEDILQELGVSDAAFVVSRPSDFTHGDYTTNAALVVAKLLHKSPREVAELMLQKLQTKLSTQSVSDIKVAGPGFINFYLTHEAIISEVVKAASGERPTFTSDVLGHTVMVEYTDPNPFKEFHIGHLMSNTIGESIARTLEMAGAKVLRANYQGDVGLHVAKALWGMSQKNKELGGGGVSNYTSAFLGKAYAHGAKAYEENLEVKQEIDEINKKVYTEFGSNSEVSSMYKTGREISLAHFEDLYKTLGTTFDKAFYFFESETWQKGLALVEAHENDGVFEKSDGAIVFKGERVGLHTRVFINSAGLPTYEAKDLGLLQLKKERVEKEKVTLDVSISITASEQTEYFKVMLAAAREIPEVSDIAHKTTHVAHGMMRFAEGKMSSRRGNVITGESLLMDLKDAAREKMKGRELKDSEKTAEAVAVGAIKYAILKQGKGKDIVFDPEKSLSIEGDSGPYLQYAHTRAQSLLTAAKKKSALPDSLETALTSDFSPPASRTLLERALIHNTEVLSRAVAELEPHYITTYVTELASLFNSWYASERVIGSAEEESGIILVQAFAHTMQQGLQLLGIPVPEEM